MLSSEVRRTFLDFFASRGHQRVPSSPLILPSDPTLLFANAGMNQFKEVFRGNESRPYRRAVSSQKCLRVSGKHNDLEEVGRTPRHHTFFEMLGNFSFGDYFKREAIEWAWELVTVRFGLPAERLYVTVFKGDDQVPADEEAARLWSDLAGVPAARIVALGRKDNFWQMGDIGPAGPCSEIHVDMRAQDPPSDPGRDPGRYLEIWNLVFMQYDLQPGGGLGKLPAPCVDTGAGLERMTAVLGGFPSNYDTDLFQPIIQAAAAEAGHSYGTDPVKDVSLRVISDHLRAITMLASEGVIPGPEKRGAVLRRILRRALRHGHLLGLQAPFLYRFVPVVVETLGPQFPELKEACDLIERITRREEERFDRTLSTGFARLEQRVEQMLGNAEKLFPGEEAFLMESEQGMPLDLIKDALEERGLGLDEAAYNAARAKHVQTSRVLATSKAEPAALELLTPFRQRGSIFVGRDHWRVDPVRVLGIISQGKSVDRLSQGASGELILDQTPFYAESGGQQGDRGVLTGPDFRAHVTNTQTPLPGVTLHSVTVEQGAIEPGALAVAEVDATRRRGAMRHHTATHLLHAALRRSLGTHVRQSGSLVADERLRFDFSHFESIAAEQLREIEQEVNDTIVGDLAVETLELSLEEALATGAMAFFGDRYGDRVRVVKIGDYSLELCGGTHVARTGEIGSCLVLSERGVAAGVRRLEAVTGPVAYQRARREIDLLADVGVRVGGDKGELLEELDRRLDHLKRLSRENEELKLKLARQSAAEGSTGTEVDGITVIAQRAEGLARHQRRDLVDSLRQKHSNGVIVLGAEEDGKAALVIAIGADALARIDARELAKRLGPLVGGGGGGRPDLVEAGGKNPAGIAEALHQTPEAVRSLLR